MGIEVKITPRYAIAYLHVRGHRGVSVASLNFKGQVYACVPVEGSDNIVSYQLVMKASYY